MIIKKSVPTSFAVSQRKPIHRMHIKGKWNDIPEKNSIKQESR